MDFKKLIFGTLLTAAAIAQAQVASHTTTMVKPPAPGDSMAVSSASMQVTGKPVARINGTVLTDHDLLREMMHIFPYAGTHNGFPKSQEAMIRKGALQMIEFEELVYQEATRQHMTVPAARVTQAANQFRSNFQSEEQFQQYLKSEMNGSMEQFRRSVRRSLLIDAFQKSQLDAPSQVTLAETRAFYNKNPQQFMMPEQIAFQTISVMPRENANNDAKEKARKHANELWEQAKNAHSYEQFGLLAEKYSEDDFRVNMGSHKLAPRSDLPEPVLKILDGMKLGEVSQVCQFGPFYVIFRLDSKKPAGKKPFEEVRVKLQADLHKDKYDRLRGNLDKKLRANAKIEEL
jgi:parvulin-like peptidyl-prolyl isomerase